MGKHGLKGLSGGVGDGDGDWRLELSTTLDIEPLAYIRTPDGFVTSMHDVVAQSGGSRHHVPIFNPESNRSQVSRLRLVNPSDANARVEIHGVDDAGERSDDVSFEVPAGGARTVGAQELESGGQGLSGRLGDGAGKWQLFVSADRPLQVMSLLQSPTGHLANLSTSPDVHRWVGDAETDGAKASAGQSTHTLPLVAPASERALQGFARIINHSDRAGTVEIHAIDDTGRRFGPVSLDVGAKASVHFNSTDLEDGNALKGLSGGVGDGDGDWRLELSTTLDIEPLAYIRTPDGFVTSMHDVVAQSGGSRHHVPIFNPESNRSQVSRLRLVNPSDANARVEIHGVDDAGERSDDVSFEVPAGGARTVGAQELESGGQGLSGRLGDGAGKWQLFVSADRPLQVMSLLQSPTGHLANLSTSPDVHRWVGDAETDGTRLSAGLFHTCGLLRDTGAVQCWGADDFGQSTPPAGSFVSVSAGNWHTCGVRDTGAVECWGNDRSGRSTPPADSFVSVSAGGSHTCGVRDTGAVECWGSDANGRSTPPAGKFVSVGAGWSHTCGIRDTGAVECWGNDDYGQSTPPAGVFDSVSAGGSHACGILVDTGTVECWGLDAVVRSTPPAGKFVSVSAGWQHTCGIRDTGAVECWGQDDYGQSTPPAGKFVSVSAGNSHTCGIRDTGAVECWGSDSHGQATPPDGSPVCNGAEVDIPDAVLLSVVEDELGKSSGEPITPEDMLRLTSLDYTFGSIKRGALASLTGLECATNLTELRFHANRISDLLPLAGLTNLTQLYLSRNQISDLSPLAGLTNLTDLDLFENRISDLLPLAGLTNLASHLDLSENRISDLSPLAGLTNIPSLSLSENRISDLLPLAGLTNLTELYLSRNQISDLSPLAGLTNLTDLVLSENRISDLLPLAGLTNLTWLDLSENRISNLSPLAGLTKIWTLDLTDNQISDIGPLVANPGLGEGDQLFVMSGNELSATSLSVHIPALRARGVRILR